MPPTNSLTGIRHKRLSDRATLWFAQGLVTFFRIVFRALELVGPKKRRQSLRQLREKLDGIHREGEAIRGKIQGGDVSGGIESLEERLGPYVSPENRIGLQETVAGARARRQEAEALRSITLEAGEDQARAVAGYRVYVHSHPDSPSGFSWLGSPHGLREGCELAKGDEILDTAAPRPSRNNIAAACILAAGLIAASLIVAHRPMAALSNSGTDCAHFCAACGAIHTARLPCRERGRFLSVY